MKKGDLFKNYWQRIKEVLAFFLILLTGSWVFGQTSFIDVTTAKGILPFQSTGIYGSGVSAADYDGDGDIDLFVPTAAHSPNHFYRNKGNGHFEEVAEELGISSLMQSRIALWFDYNGDHKLDLLVVGDCRLNPDCTDANPVKLYEQLSQNNFTDVTEKSGLYLGVPSNSSQMAGGLAAADVNSDGFLDVMISYWYGKVYLFINKGNGTFKDIGASNLSSEIKSYLQPLIFDFNKDGLADINLNVDGGENLFWINNGDGTYNEIGKNIHLNSKLNEMGTALGDYDNDGDMDIYMTNVTGNQSHNVLFRNDSHEGRLIFSEVAKTLGVHEGGWGWGTTFLDANNDGFLDLAETNGISANMRMPAKFWFNTGSEGFKDASAEIGFTDDLDGTTLIALDFDRDGDLDLVETLKKRQGQPTDLRLLENQLNITDQAGNYLVIKPRMTGQNHFAIGSTVKVRIGDLTLSRPILAGNSFFGQEPAEAFFGLGSKTHVDEIIVEWPGGTISTKKDVDINQIVVITDENLLHAPTALKVEKMDLDGLVLTWSHIPTDETGFILQRSLNNTFEPVVEFNLEKFTRSFSDKDILPGLIYHYRIKAVNDVTSSKYSRTFTTLIQEHVEPPSNLSAVNFDHSQIELQWNDNSENESNFVLEKSTLLDSVESATLLVHLGKDQTSFIDKDVTPNSQYIYRIQATSEKGKSAFSDPLGIKTLDFVQKPGNLKGTFGDTNQVLLDWKDHADNETGFVIERSISESFNYVRHFFLEKDISNFTDAEIVPGTQFYYRIKAYNHNISSSYSNIFAIKMPMPNKVEEEHRLILFTNTINKEIGLSLENNYYGLLHVRISNSLGQVLFHKKYEKMKFKFNELLNIRSSPGIYYLTLATASERFHKKFIISQ